MKISVLNEEKRESALWYLMSDFFYRYKCTCGLSDPKDPNYYQFKKNKYKFCIRRLNNHDFRLRVIEQVKYIDIMYYQLKSLEEAENAILDYFKK